MAGSSTGRGYTNLNTRLVNPSKIKFGSVARRARGTTLALGQPPPPSPHIYITHSK
jgi:hypothetical protein